LLVRWVAMVLRVYDRQQDANGLMLVLGESGGSRVQW
jgi:hypothetical protein